MLNKTVVFFYKIYRAAFPPFMREKLAPILAKVLPGTVNTINHVRRKNLDILNVPLADHCNLNCKSCRTFSPVASEHFMKLETFVNDFTRLKELTHGKIGIVKLLGGEPLLHPELLDIIKNMRKLFPKTKIQITTNGVLLKKQDEVFWETCAETKTNIVISHYPINIHYDELCEKARQHRVSLVYDCNETKTQMDNNAKFMQKNPYDLSGLQNAKDNFYKCEFSNQCIMLHDGKIVTCGNIYFIKYFNSYFNQNIPVTEKDYIDIYEAQSIGEILDFLSLPPPFCAYCNLDAAVGNLSWEVSKKEITEWT